MSWHRGNERRKSTEPYIDGVILFRGLSIRGPSDLSRFVSSFGLPRPHQEVGLAGKRSSVTTNVKTANEEPPDVKFYYHSEYGRSAFFPGVLFFYSEKVPESGKYSPSLNLYLQPDVQRRWSNTDPFIS